MQRIAGATLSPLSLHGTGRTCQHRERAAKNPCTGRLVLFAHLTLALLVAAMLWALASDNKAALWLGYAAFALEVLFLYEHTFRTLLNTSLFFLVAALIVSALAAAAYRLRQRRPASGAGA